jgi:hypothetical protein
VVDLLDLIFDEKQVIDSLAADAAQQINSQGVGWCESENEINTEMALTIVFFVRHVCHTAQRRDLDQMQKVHRCREPTRLCQLTLIVNFAQDVVLKVIFMHICYY